MKKLIIFFVVVLLSSVAYAQDVLDLFMYTDDMNFATPLFLSDGVTPIPDGYLIEVCLPTTPSTYDFENDPHGASLNNVWATAYMNGNSQLGMPGFYYAESYFIWEDPLGSPSEPVANCGDQAYLRVYNAANIANATEYRNSGFGTGPAAGSAPVETEVGGWGAWLPISSGPTPPSLATLVAPADGAIIPPLNVLLEWGYVGEDVTGYEVYFGTLAAVWVADVTNGNKFYNVGDLLEGTAYQWKIIPYIQTDAIGGKRNVAQKTKVVNNSRGSRDRIYPEGTPDTWAFATWDPTPPPPPPIVPPGGGTTSFNFNGGTGAGAGSTVGFTPPANGGTGAVTVDIIDPTTIPGLANPDAALLVYNITGYNGDYPVHLEFTWEYPAPSGTDLPVLLVSRDGGNTFINVLADPNVSGIVWNLLVSPYSVSFDTMLLSEWVVGDGEDDPLPVSLSSFTAEFSNGHPVLNWTTQSETDNLGWNIYRSMNENGYDENDYTQSNSEMVPGMGISTQPTEYTFVDEYPVIEGLTYYYWLQSVSTTNDVDLYGPVSVQIPIQGLIPHVVLETALNPNYPNPFNPSTMIKFNIEEGENGTLTIYNIKGQTILQKKFESGEYSMEWNADGLSSGIYFYRLLTPSKDITRKMLLMK